MNLECKARVAGSIESAIRVRKSSRIVWAQTRFGMSIQKVLLSLSIVLVASGAVAQEVDYLDDYNSGDSGLGITVRLGLPINVPSIDVPGGDLTAGAGIAIGGGYEVFDWLVADFDLTISGGHEYEVRRRVGPFVVQGSDDLTYVSFAVGARMYPFEVFDLGLPDWVKPYGFVGIGGNGFHGDFIDDSGFIGRFTVGSDFSVFDRIGAYAEVGVDATTISGVDAVTRIAFGATYRF